MERLIFTLTPKTAFATPLAGDTLFGQCCWAIRHCFGAEKLTALLTGYTENKPFMVISDAMPQVFYCVQRCRVNYWVLKTTQNYAKPKKRKNGFLNRF